MGAEHCFAEWHRLLKWLNNVKPREVLTSSAHEKEELCESLAHLLLGRGKKAVRFLLFLSNLGPGGVYN